MHKDNRKSKRRPMRYTAWIVPKPGKFHGCVLTDVSDTGARIKVEDSEKIPDRFMLLLARNGKARRPCHVVWRKPIELGVRFEAMLAAADRAELLPQKEAPSLAPAGEDSAPATST